MSEIRDKIAELIAMTSNNTNSFSKEIGVSPTVLYNILKGRNNPSYELIEKIIFRFNVCPNWIFLGKHPIFDKNESNELNQAERIKSLGTSVSIGDFKRVQEAFRIYNLNRDKGFEFDSFLEFSKKIELLAAVLVKIHYEMEKEVSYIYNSNSEESVLPKNVINLISKYESIYQEVCKSKEAMQELTGDLIKNKAQIFADAILEIIKNGESVPVGFNK